MTRLLGRRIVFLLSLCSVKLASCFLPHPLENTRSQHKTALSRQYDALLLQPFPSTTSSRRVSTSTTQLHVLLDVPEGFFTVTFPMLGILLSISKNFGRVRMEERAWEQRLEEAQRAKLQADPTLTELDLRRQEAALEWSAYGKPRLQEEEAAREKTTGRRRRVQVLENDGNDEPVVDSRAYRMTEDEIEAFELEFGVQYDPYYDDPYTEDELPEGKYDVDRLYGDRIYENGEIFYKDAKTKLYYRQGCKPRNLSFWG